MSSPVASCSQPSTSRLSSEAKAPKNRIFTKIPVFIVENHNDVLELLLPVLANRYLPFENNVMVHFDSHPDMCVPRQMTAECVYNRQTLLESLSIENWIVPLMFAKHLKEVIWVRPDWAQQIADGRHMFSVGESDDKIFVSSTLDYFLSDGGYKDKKVMKSTKDVTVHVSQVEESLNELLNNETNWILDIDLDYFSTLNPFLSIYPKAGTYEKLRRIFKMDKSYDVNDHESISRFVERRNLELNFFETVFQHMAQHGTIEKFKCDDPSMQEKLELVKELIECLCSHYSIYDIDWFVVNDAGCTCDDDEHQLPHHESSEDEIKQIIEKFERFLKSVKSPPTLITIARSSLDGYTPVHQVDTIQSQVIQSLRNVFAENLATETLWYKNSSADVSALELVEPRKK